MASQWWYHAEMDSANATTIPLQMARFPTVVTESWFTVVTYGTTSIPAEIRSQSPFTASCSSAKML